MSIKDIIMPKVSNELEEAILINWQVNVGDRVKKGDIIFNVETEKTTLEVESEYSGVILGIFIENGTKVPLFTVVGKMEIDE